MTPSHANRSYGSARQTHPARASDAPLGFRVCAALPMIARTRSPGIAASSHPRPPVNRGAVFLLAANARHFAEYLAVRPKRRTRYDRMAARSRERTTPSGTCEACQKPAIRLTRRMAVRRPSRRSKGARGNVRRPPAHRIDGATRPLPASPPPSVLCAACPARQGKAIMDVLPARAPVIKQIFESPMVDMHLHGRARGHHKFTVASMVSRRAGRTFSHLACGTGSMMVGRARRPLALHQAGPSDTD
jgi:hypothetical protein